MPAAPVMGRQGDLVRQQCRLWQGATLASGIRALHRAGAAVQAAIAVAGRSARDGLADKAQAAEQHHENDEQLAHGAIVVP